MKNYYVKFLCGTVLRLPDLEDAGLSYVPCARLPNDEGEMEDRPYFTFANLWGQHSQVTLSSYGRKANAWAMAKWQKYEFPGVQLMTGKPTYRHLRRNDYLSYPSIDIEAHMIQDYPEQVAQIQQLYEASVDGTPCILATKSGGLRLDAYTEYVGNKMSFKDEGGMLLEILGNKCLARIDSRYGMIQGSILDMPTLPKETLQDIHQIISEIATVEESDNEPREVVEKSQLGDLGIQWDSTGRSQLFPTAHCQRTAHRSNRDEVRFTKHADGSVDGKCFNCGETWWEIEPPPRQKRYRAKLQRSDDAPSQKTETLDENRAKRETATDTFLSSHTDNATHILLLKDATGSGKSHTILSKTKGHGKRTIINPPHTELASQAIETAREHGYVNPFHILGREHNWEESGISRIPVKERTVDLFERNNCIMVDEIKTYTDKRLAQRTYCEHKCEFRDDCRHLAQYKGLGKRDLIASCTPNLLFDLNMRGYLNALVTATDEPSDEELAIDTILGTESETTTEFDFAVLDDFGVSGLYTDITLSQSDFSELKKAWEGTPTGQFATLMLKAFKKRKPQKIVRALRTALETTVDHHTEIAKSLTQHARLGVVEYASKPKASKETQRLLSEKEVKYVDKGRQFIPIDFDAHKELTEKGIPSVNPQLLEIQEVGELVRVPHAPTHALIAGVPLDQLTPVWQKGATPIELLKIFIDSIGNDRNAPINRTFRTGDPPIAMLNFSIPPQAPTGILPQIAMLSATSDIEAVKQAFTGQAISFSEHTGGVLEFARGVEIYQYESARITSASVFEYPEDANGKRLLQEPPTGLKSTAEKRLRKLNEWAREQDGLTAFISYKEFTSADPFTEHVNAFDIVTHFDKVAGLNFEGLKYLVVFGYPKVKHEILMEHARKQYASDNNPLPKADPTLCDDNGKVISEYMQLTEVITVSENGYEITERRYKDPRLEKIRHQLSTEKLKQALGRARLIRWEDTTTLLMTNAPVKGFTQRTTLCSDAALHLAETPSEIPAAMDRIRVAEETGDVKAIMETKDVSQRTAERETQPVRKARETEKNATIIRLHHDGHSQSEIERQLKSMGYTTGISRKTIRSVVKIDEQVGKNDNAYKYIPIGDVANAHPPENLDDTGIERVLPQKEVIPTEQVERVPDTQNAAPKTIPLSEYSSLDDETVQLELERCQERNNYNGAAFLRNLLRKRGASDQPPVKKDDTEETILHLFDWDISTVYLRREEISAHTDVSTGLTQKCLIYACEAPNIVCEEVSKDGKTDTI